MTSQIKRPQAYGVNEGLEVGHLILHPVTPLGIAGALPETRQVGSNDPKAAGEVTGQRKPMILVVATAVQEQQGIPAPPLQVGETQSIDLHLFGRQSHPVPLKVEDQPGPGGSRDTLKGYDESNQKDQDPYDDYMVDLFSLNHRMILLFPPHSALFASVFYRKKVFRSTDFNTRFLKPQKGGKVCTLTLFVIIFPPKPSRSDHVFHRRHRRGP